MTSQQVCNSITIFYDEDEIPADLDSSICNILQSK